MSAPVSLEVTSIDCGSTSVGAGAATIVSDMVVAKKEIAAMPDLLTNKIIKGTREAVYTITDSASVDIDPNNGSIQIWTLGASRTPTARNFSNGTSLTLMVADGSAFTITWTAIGVVWVATTAPTLPTTGYAVIELWKVIDTIYGSYIGDVA